MRAGAQLSHPALFWHDLCFTEVTTAWGVPLLLFEFLKWGRLLQCRPFFHLLSPWIICYPPDLSTVSTCETILCIWWEERLPHWLWSGEGELQVSQNLPFWEGRKSFIIPFLEMQWQDLEGEKRTDKAGLAWVISGRNWGTRHEEHHDWCSCICTLKWCLKF